MAAASASHFARLSQQATQFAKGSLDTGKCAWLAAARSSAQKLRALGRLLCLRVGILLARSSSGGDARDSAAEAYAHARPSNPSPSGARMLFDKPPSPWHEPVNPPGKSEFPFQASRFEHEGKTCRGPHLQAAVRCDLATDCRGGS